MFRFICAKLLFLILLIPAAFAQEGKEISFQHYGTSEGLSQNNVKAIIQDYQGFMWFASDDGLNRFDGYDFTVYKNIASDSTSLPSNIILVLYEDKDNNL